MRTFVVVGNDYSGLGWVKKLMDEGEQAIYAYEYPDDFDDEDEKHRFEMCGEGVIDKLPLDQAVKKYTADDVYWIFDSNTCVETATKLRKEGRRVFGADEMAAELEHDRATAMQMAEEAGLGIADMIECKDIAQGLDYLQTNDDKAYVFKPNDSTLHYLTFVPQHEDDPESNRILQEFLTNFSRPLNKGFVLQERKKGVEVNFELWLQKGKPVLATCGLESKRLLDRDLGEHCGCAQDIMFTVPMDCKGIKDTVGKTTKFYEGFTGFIDVNVIIADREIWFLEVCDRFGYSAHPNQFLNLATDTTGNILADLVDGKTNFEERFRKGFGASINLNITHPREGWPMVITEKVDPHYYPYDLMKEGDSYALSGYSMDVGVVCRHGYTIEEASHNAMDVLHRQRVWFPDMGYRTDLGERGYASSPTLRYEALHAMGMFHV